MAKKIFIIAGEASGDNIGSKLMKSLKLRNQKIEFYGVGGPKMEKQGLSSLFPMKELSIMGFLEILPYIPKFLYRIKQTVSHIREIKPDIVITIDSPGFNFRIAKKIKKLGIKLVHYVAPTVWAYKPERAKKIAKLYDHLLVILPWEPEYFIKEGLATTYVGHPIIEDYERVPHIYKKKNIISIMPGSRKIEIKRLLPIFIDAMKIVEKQVNDISIVIHTLPHLVSYIEKIIQKFKRDIVILSQDETKKLALRESRAAIVKSGTVSFEVAMNNVPMLIAYKINKFSAYLVKKMLKIKYVNLINLIHDKEIIPEFLQDNCTSVNIANALIELLENKEIAKNQTNAINETLKILGLEDTASPSDKAAKIISNYGFLNN